MKKSVPYIIMLILTLALLITVIPSVIRKLNILPQNEGSDTNKLVITMHGLPNKRSYGNEMRIKTITVNGEQLDLSQYSNDSWVWHPEWGYMLYQEGDNTLTVDIDHYLDSLDVTMIEQEGSGKCTVSLNGLAEKSYDLYSSNWHETVYSVKYVDDFYLTYLKLSFGFVLFMLMFLIYRICMYGFGIEKYVPQKIGLASFDFAKGLGILLVILGHSAQDVTSEDAYISTNILFAVIAIVFLYAVLPMFFVVNGYGSKAVDPKNNLKRQLRILAEFYGIYIVVVIVIDAVKMFTVPDYSKAEFVKQVAAFLTLSIHDVSINGLEIGTIGPMWFFVSLCIGRIVLNRILMIRNNKTQTIVAALVLIPFYFLIKHDFALLCLTTICSALIFLYMGHCLSRYKIFRMSNNCIPMIFIFGSIVFFATALLNGTYFSIAGNYWGNNIFLGLFISVLGGTVMTWLCLQYGNTVFRSFRAVRKIGRMSAFFFLAHSIEYMTIPWGKIIQQLNAGFYVKSITVFLCRMIVVSLLTWILMRVYGRLHRKKQRN